MHNLQLDELVANNPTDYVNIAAKLAADIEYLSSIRASLRNIMKTSPLMNAGRFTIHLENEYRRIWKRWCVMAENQAQKV